MMENSTLSYMIESQHKAAKKLGHEALNKKPDRDKIKRLTKEATWHTEQILKKVKEIE